MKQLPWILVGVLTAALLFSLFFRGCADPGSGTADTVWLPVRVDTLRDTAVAPPVSERPTGTDTARLPVLRPQKPSVPASGAEDSAAVARPDTLETGRFPVRKDSIAADSADVLIPITEKEYRTDDYRIVVSGYRPRLVSAEFYRQTQTGVVTPPAPKRKRWGIGLSVGYGVGPDGKMGAVVAVTLNYNLLQW